MAEDLAFPNTPGTVMVPVLRQVDIPGGGKGFEIARWYPAMQDSLRTNVYIGTGTTYETDVANAANYQGAPGITTVMTEEEVIMVPGEKGQDGSVGMSAYEVAVANGFSGTTSEWLNSLIGQPGANGLSAFEVWKASGGQGDINSFLASLVGSRGEQGIEGEKGDTGNTGAIGPQGNVGATGPKGDTGSQGPIGNTGLTGSIGPKGDTGSQGSTGPTGNTGPQGASGVKGDTGLPGATLLGTVTLTESALIGLAIGTSRAPLVFPSAWGVSVGNVLLVSPVSLPAGVATHDVIVTSSTAGTVGITKPLLTIGAGSITLRVIRINV